MPKKKKEKVNIPLGKKEIKDKLGAPSAKPDNQIRQEAVDSILEKGVDFTVAIQNKNILHKLKLTPPERKFVIYPIKMGALLKISEILLDLNIDELVNVMKGEGKGVNLLDLGAKNIIENKDKLIKMIAYGIRNCDKEPPESLIRFLNENLTTKEGLKLMMLIVQQMDVNPFLASLVSIRGMNLLQTKKQAITPGESSAG